MKVKLLIPIAICLLFFSCQNENNNDTVLSKSLFSKIEASASGLDFSNSLKEDIQNNISNFDYYYNGSGVAVGDINNDALVDIFFTSNTGQNALYLNKGNLKFEDISDKSGISKINRWSNGVTMVDVNGDGFLDIYVCNGGSNTSTNNPANELYINNGDLTFSDQAAAFGLNDKGRSVQACFFDMDKDEDLDLFVMNHSNYQRMNALSFDSTLNKLNKEDFHIECNHLYENVGNSKFVDISEAAGVLKPGFGLGLNCSDIDDDGWVDIYVANDFFIPDFLFKNKGDKLFKDEINTSTSHISYFSMGCDVADVNNDGLLDISVVDMASSDHIRSKTLMASMDVQKFDILKNYLGYQSQFMFNSLQMNIGNGIFSEISQYAGVSKTEWSWATLFADFDNDGLKDNFVSNGFKRDTKDNDYRLERVKLRDSLLNLGLPKNEVNKKIFDHLSTAPSQALNNYLYKNIGDFKFKDHGKAWGMTDPSFSNGAAYADLDNDGDLDLIVNNLDKKAFLYRNNSTGNNYLQINLKDSRTNNQGIYNAKVKLYYNDGVINMQELNPVRGYLSSVDPVLHFGIGSVEKIDKISIKWIDDTETILKDVPVNQRLDIDKASQKLLPFEVNEPKTVFREMTSFFKEVDFKHKENSFNDFEKEILLPYKMSTLGPFVSIGDLNGDKLSDIFVGGALGQSAEIFLQVKEGNFKKTNQRALVNDGKYEDMGSTFFDLDNDGDLDLYVGSGGGGDITDRKDLMTDRVYINDGKGNFTKAKGALPKFNISTSRIKAFDFNKDGYTDLFVGGRNTPGKYPHPTNSFLLENNRKGAFVDVSEKYIPGLQNIGMVTDAEWTDFNGDNLVDLIIVGEWMNVKLFKNNGQNQFEDVSTAYGLENTTGLWMSIGQADIDKDGDIDYVVGNLGDNNKFKANENKPLHIYCNDFDNNETQDIVLSTIYKGNKVPIRGKECSTEQMPFISDKFPSYKSFATATLEELYGDDKLEEAIHYKTELLSSIFLINEGNKFSIKKLPPMAQIAPINDMVVFDFNQDSHLDIIIGGNLFNTEVETGQYDAGKGLLLKGKGNFEFDEIPNRLSGIFLPNDLKSLEPIVLTRQGRSFFGLIGSNNNGSLQIFAQWQKDVIQ